MAETKTAAKKPAAKKTTSSAKAPAKKATVKVEEKVEVKEAATPVAEVKTEAPKKTASKKAEKQLKITLVKSGAGRLEKQTRTLEALGLRKTNSSTIKPDNACTRGMIFVVKHLVKVEEV